MKTLCKHCDVCEDFVYKRKRKGKFKGYFFKFKYCNAIKKLVESHEWTGRTNRPSYTYIIRNHSPQIPIESFIKQDDSTEIRHLNGGLDVRLRYLKEIPSKRNIEKDTKALTPRFRYEKGIISLIYNFDEDIWILQIEDEDEGNNILICETREEALESIEYIRENSKTRDARFIKLDHGKKVLVDNADFDWLNHWDWLCSNNSTRKDGTKYWQVYRWLSFEEQQKEGKRSISMSHQIMGRPGHNETVAYVNFNSLDCRRSNLKRMTRREVAMRMRKPKTSPLPGAAYMKNRQKWAGFISLKGVVKFLGFYGTDKEAHRAYLKALNELNEGVPLDEVSMKSAKHSSKYKGVSWDKNKKKWVVIITRDKVNKFLGHFESEEKAGEAYKNAVQELEKGVPLNELTTYSRKRKSKYKGVYPRKNGWQVKFTRNSKEIYVGHFLDEEEAHHAYLEAIKEYEESH